MLILESKGDFMIRFILLTVFLSVSSLTYASANGKGPLGYIFKSCGFCHEQVWQGYQQVHRMSCDVIGYGGKSQSIQWNCDPDATDACNTMQLKLLNQVSLGKLACDSARKTYDDAGCGELGYPDCALFSR